MKTLLAIKFKNNESVLLTVLFQIQQCMFSQFAKLFLLLTVGFRNCWYM